LPGAVYQFVGNESDERDIGRSGTASVLTVADTPDLSDMEEWFQFVLEGNKVKFEINLAAAQHAG